MRKSKFLPILLSLSGLLGFFGLLSAANRPASSLPARHLSSAGDTLHKMKASDHKKVGALMGDCIRASVAHEGKRDAEEELRHYIQKGKWAKAAGKNGDVLSLSDDLAAALWYAQDYTKTKGVRKGKLDKLEIPIPYNGDYVAHNLIWIPKKYSPKKSYPLVFCLPAVGQDLKQHMNDDWALSALRDGAILVVLDLPETAEYWGVLGVKGDSNKAGGRAILLSTFKLLAEKYAIDFTRVFVAGRGAGVAAAMQIVDASPDRFAGIIGRAGDAAEMEPTNLSNVPCFFAGGGSRATAYVEASAKAKFVLSVVNPAATTEDVWTWIQATQRNSNPESVHLIPGRPSNKAYWIELPNAEYLDDASIVASTNRAANTITVDASGVESVTIFFNDTLVDLDQKVKVILNGAVHEDVIPRNFFTMMEQIYRTRSDAGKLYTAFKTYDLPKKAESKSSD